MIRRIAPRPSSLGLAEEDARTALALSDFRYPLSGFGRPGRQPSPRLRHGAARSGPALLKYRRIISSALSLEQARAV